MLQSFRDNTQSIIVKIIIGFIIITFALFGVDSLIGLAAKPDAPVTVNGTDITERQISEGIDLRRRQLIREMGADADPALLEDSALREPVVENLIQREVLKQYIENHNLRISDAFLDASIRSTAEFQVDGRFDPNRFQAVIRNVGMTPMMYREQLREEVLMAQHQNGVLASSFLLSDELDRIAALDRQTRSFKTRTFSVDAVKDEIEVTDAEIEAFYDEHADELRAPEQVAVNYIELSREALAKKVDVSEAELRTEYERAVAGFEAEEAREASHILISIDEDTTEAEARDQAAELRQQLQQGADFAALAQEYSDDPGSAEQGGALGVVEQGVMVPEFEETLFTMDEAGAVSEPVKTDFGYHLIRLDAIDQPEPPTFAEMRAELLHDLQMQKSENLFVSQSSELDDLRFATTDLQEASDVLGLPIQSTGFFDRDGGDTAVTQSPAVLQAAFSDMVLVEGENSELIELGGDHILVLNVKEHKPERALQLDEVRDQIAAQLIDQKARQRAAEQARELIANIDADSELDSGDWQTFTEVGRNSTAVASELADEVFKLPHPAQQPVVAMTTAADGSAVVMVLTSVNDEVPELSPQQRQGLNDFLASHYGQAAYQNQVMHLIETAEVERNR